MRGDCGAVGALDGGGRGAGRPSLQLQLCPVLVAPCRSPQSSTPRACHVMEFSNPFSWSCPPSPFIIPRVQGTSADPPNGYPQEGGRGQRVPGAAAQLRFTRSSHRGLSAEILCDFHSTSRRRRPLPPAAGRCRRTRQQTAMLAPPASACISTTRSPRPHRRLWRGRW